MYVHVHTGTCSYQLKLIFKIGQLECVCCFVVAIIEVYSASSISSNKAGTDMASVLQERLSKVAKDEVPGKKNLYLSLQIF